MAAKEQDQLRHLYPINVSTFENSVLYGAIATCTGRRKSNEDEHDMRLSDDLSLFGIYDGHGGKQACQFLKANLMDRINQLEEAQRDNAEALVATFLAVDTKLQERVKENCASEAGSTAVLAVVKKLQNSDASWKITTANVGDSQSILLHNGTSTVLSTLHHPGVPEEKTRIEQAGGMVTKDRLGNSRIFGILAVSRAFGDFEFKTPAQMVTAQPQVNTTNASTGDYLLLSCDGLFEPKDMTVDYVSSFLERELKTVSKDGKGIGTVLEKIILQALKSGSQDNITVLLVRLSPPACATPEKPKEKENETHHEAKQ